MNEAIKLAIEKGGYKLWGILDRPDFCDWWIHHRGSYLDSSAGISISLQDDIKLSEGDVARSSFGWSFAEVTQDPLFWQALGKALGWGETVGMIKNGIPVWLNEANKYFNLLLTNGDTEKFWKELIAQ